MELRRYTTTHKPLTDCTIPDDKPGVYIKETLGFQLTASWGDESLSVNLYTHPKEPPNNADDFVTLVRIGHFVETYCFDNITMLTEYLSGPLALIKTHLEITSRHVPER